MEKRTNPKTFEGIVLSNKMQKTIVVQCVRDFHHPSYSKRIKKLKKYYVHDEKSEAKEGQKVQIAECRPYSRLKRFRLVKIYQ